jgi:SulP family sulfate permease
MIIAALTFIRRVTSTTTISEITPEDIDSGRSHILQDKALPPYVAIFRIHGPFLFGSTDKINSIFERTGELPEVVVLRLRNMTAIDGTGLLALEELAEHLRASGRTLLVCGARQQPSVMLHDSRFEEMVGRENICRDVSHALQRAEQIHQAPHPAHAGGA